MTFDPVPCRASSATTVPMKSDDGEGSAEFVPDADPHGESVVSDPAELIRLVNMLQVLMFEVHDVTLDEDGRRRLLDVHRRAVEAVKRLVSDDLDRELAELGLPIEDAGASTAAIKIAQAQLVGWLNGLFQGIQAAMSARRFVPVEQLQEIQRQIAQSSQNRPVGQYL